MTETHANTAVSYLQTASAQLENYYNDYENKNLINPDMTEEDRATCLREAQINALLAIGHALTSLATYGIGIWKET